MKLKECWCCGGLHDSIGSLCPDCSDAGCSRFSDSCRSDHQPVVSDGGASGSSIERQECPECGTPMEQYVPTNWNCPDCDRDYWREGNGWWSCDMNGEVQRV